MGKTAQIIALILSTQNTANGTLVVTPQHLTNQWKNEIRKFAGDQVKVYMITSLTDWMRSVWDECPPAVAPLPVYICRSRAGLLESCTKGRRTLYKHKPPVFHGWFVGVQCASCRSNWLYALTAAGGL